MKLYSVLTAGDSFRVIKKKRRRKQSWNFGEIALLNQILIIGIVGFIFLNFSISSDAYGATYYISPSGSDSNPGTSSNPWRTFNNSIQKLKPGDTLILMDGTYTKNNTGLPDINCAKNAKSGTATQPITLKAENERRAFLKGDGSVDSFRMRYCSWWNVEGLRGESGDNDSGSSTVLGSVFKFENVNNISTRRLLAVKPNRYKNSHGISFRDSANILVEESEVYWFHRWGIVISKTSGVLRRNYTNSRDYPDIKGGWVSHPNTGDVGLGTYPTVGSGGVIIENCIAESNHAGINTGTGTASKPVNVLGSIALSNSSSGIVVGDKNMEPVDTIIKDSVVLGNSAHGIWVQNGTNIQLENVTSYNNSAQGFYATDRTTNEFRSTFFTNILSFNNGKAGLHINDQDDWLVNYSNSQSYSGNNYPSSGKVIKCSSTKPTLIGLGSKECIVYVPSGSNMKGAGIYGEDIGANIIFRYEDGILTSKKLWDQNTGQFPCGAIVAGVNDIPGESCFDVHKRLNVGVNGCPIP